MEFRRAIRILVFKFLTQDVSWGRCETSRIAKVSFTFRILELDEIVYFGTNKCVRYNRQLDEVLRWNRAHTLKDDPSYVLVKSVFAKTDRICVSISNNFPSSPTVARQNDIV